MPIDDRKRFSQTADGDGTKITSTQDGLKRRLDTSISAPASNPVHVQAEQQIVASEVASVTLTPAPLSAFTGTGPELFDKDMNTEITYDGVAYPAAITTMFTHPLKIACIGLRSGTLPVRGVRIDVIGIDGVITTVVNLPPGTSVDGVESPEFGPMLAVGVDIILQDNPGNSMSISELTILKAIKVDATVTIPPISVSNTPDDPLFTQMQQQIVNGEAVVILGPGWVGDPLSLLDKDMTTGIVGGGPFDINLTHPKLVAHVGIRGLLNGVVVELETIDGQFILLTPTPVTNDYGWSSVNFAPVEMVALHILALGETPPTEITEVTIYKVIEVKGAGGGSLSNDPAHPIYAQMQQQLVLGEVNIYSDYMGGNPDNNPNNIMDKDNTTYISTDRGGYIQIIPTHPKLVGRICITGVFTGMTIQAHDIKGNVVHFWDDQDSVGGGWDSENFTPFELGDMVMSTQDAATIFEVVVHKVIETKATIHSTPAEPVFVQDQGQIVLDEVDVAISTIASSVPISGSILELFDKNYQTEMVMDGGAGTFILIFLKSPLLIARVSALSYFFGANLMRKDVIISIIDVDGNQHTVYDGSNIYNAPSYGVGVDSQNFKDQPTTSPISLPSSPIWAVAISITTIYDDTGIPWGIGELGILKVKEVKAFVYNEPSEPVFIEDDQHLCLDEIWWELSYGYLTTGDLNRPFKKNPTPILRPLIIYPGGSLNYQLNTNHLFARISIKGTMSEGLTVQYVKPDGTIITLPNSLSYNYDSDNVAPFNTDTILITNQTQDIINIIDISAWKAHEVKIATDPAHPTQVQAEQQITPDEVDFVNSLAWSTETGNLAPLDYKLLMDKSIFGPMITYTYPGTPAPVTIIRIVFKTMQMISRVCLAHYLQTTGFLPFKIIVNRCAGLPVTVYEVPPATDMGEASDSGNFDPMVAWSIDIVLSDASMVLQELGIWKVIEVKSAINRNAELEEVLFPTEVLSPGSSMGPGGLPVPPLSALAGKGIKIEKVQQNTVNAELVIFDTGSIGTMLLDVHWAYSPDNVNWYYMSTFTITEVAAPLNPSGFLIAGPNSMARRIVAQPVGAFNKYMAIYIHNKGTGAITVSGAIVKQR